jgi:hypothetical protein
LSRRIAGAGRRRPGGLRGLSLPRPARVVTGVRGEPRAVDGLAVGAVAEDWVV